MSRRIFYFGWQESYGHCLKNPRGSSREAERTLPFDYHILDAALLPQDGDETEGVIYRNVINGWTVLSFWDRSGDSRRKSNTSFIIEGDVDTQFGLRLAREHFPVVMDRFKFNLAEAKCKHFWTGGKCSTPSEPDEYIEFCELCGIENQGSGELGKTT